MEGSGGMSIAADVGHQANVSDPRSCYIGDDKQGYCFTKKVPTRVRLGALRQEYNICPACGGPLRRDQ